MEAGTHLSTATEIKTLRKPIVSIVVPHLNQPRELERCLASLTAQTGISMPFEIIVVDNGSIELPTGICAAHENVRLLAESRPGPGPARNKGVEAAKGDLLAFIDADCVAGAEWLATIVRCLTDDTTILGGDVRILCEDPRDPTLLECYESVFAYRMKEYIEKKGFTGTGNLAMRRSVFRKVGPFADINVAEDAEWGRRAAKIGYRITYVPEMIVYHPARRSFGELERKWDRHIAHDFHLAEKRRYGRARWMLWAMAVALSPLAETFRIARSDRLGGVRARVLAMVGVSAVRLYRARIMWALVLGAKSASDLSGRWNR